MGAIRASIFRWIAKGVEPFVQGTAILVANSVDTTAGHALVKSGPQLLAYLFTAASQQRFEEHQRELADGLRQLGARVDEFPELILEGIKAAAVMDDRAQRERLRNALVNLSKSPPAQETEGTESAVEWKQNADVMRSACFRAVTELTTLEVEILGTVEEIYSQKGSIPAGANMTSDQIWEMLIVRRGKASREAFLAGVRHLIVLGLLEEPNVWGGGALAPTQLTFRFLAVIRQPDTTQPT